MRRDRRERRSAARPRAQTPASVRLHEVTDLAGRLREGTVLPAMAAAINGGGEGVYRLAVGWLLCAAVLEAHRENGRAARDTGGSRRRAA